MGNAGKMPFKGRPGLRAFDALERDGRTDQNVDEFGRYFVPSVSNTFTLVTAAIVSQKVSMSTSTSGILRARGDAGGQIPVSCVLGA